MHKHVTLLLHLLLVAALLSGCATAAGAATPAGATPAAVEAATQPPAAQPAATQAVAQAATQPPATTAAPAAASSVAPTAAPASAATTAAPGPTPTEIPLKDALTSLEPQDVFTNFYNLTQVPRPSGYMDKIQPYMVSFGQGLGLQTVVDNAGNVIIRKPATPGYENRQGVVLQAHMDMVPQAAEGVNFDFETDPIQAFVQGDYIVTNGTTLGADDGMGMAVAMAILQSQTLKAGPIEALFTVDEETTMSGANGLKAGELQGSILINLDWETEGSFDIGSAGGVDVYMNSTYEELPAPLGLVAYQMKVSGLQGGHSGMDINKGRGSATKLLARLLSTAAPLYGLQVADFQGGSARNAIPTEADATVFIAENMVDDFTQYVTDYQTTVKTELAATEPTLAVTLTAVDSPPARVMNPKFQAAFIDGLYGNPQGVLRMSDSVPDLVETSDNMGVVSAKNGQVQVQNFPRSSVDSELTDATQMIGSVWDLAGYKIGTNNRFPGWNPNPDSPILALMQSTYKDLFGTDPDVTAVHAGLECGAIGATYPEMDMISIGPTTLDVHTPNERSYIPSVSKLMQLVTAVLEQIPETSK